MSDLLLHFNNFVCLLMLTISFVWALPKTVLGNVAVIAQNGKAIFRPSALFKVVIDMATAYPGTVLTAILVDMLQSKKFLVGFATAGASAAIGVKHFLPNTLALGALAALDFFVMPFNLFFLVARPTKAARYMRSVGMAFGLDNIDPLPLIAVFAKPVPVVRSVGMAGRSLPFTARPIKAARFDAPSAGVIVDYLRRHAKFTSDVLVGSLLDFNLLFQPLRLLIRFFIGHLLTPSERCVVTSKVFIPPGTRHIPRYTFAAAALA